MRIVVAIGGNALLRRGERPDATVQVDHIRAAAEALAPLALRHQLIVCHGNGPQVGMLSLESENDPELTHPYPFDALVAQTQGMIGYWLAQSLRNAGVTKPVMSLVTQTLVDPSDHAFATPTKFVGPGYTHRQAERLADRHSWTIAVDGDRWRRVVASPEPLRIIEQESIDGLLDHEAIVICGGGGGIPVSEDGAGQLQGVEAEVDKDATAALLAVAVKADRLLILTDVPAVMEDFGTPQATPLRRLALGGSAALHFPAGSMGPKVAACGYFVGATGRTAAIGSLDDAAAVLAGDAGTVVVPHDPSDASSGIREGAPASLQS